MLKRFSILLVLFSCIAAMAGESIDMFGELPDVSIPDVEISDVTLNNVIIEGETNVNRSDEVGRDIAGSFTDKDIRIEDSLTSLTESNEIFADKRMLEFDDSIIAESNVVKAWKKIYEENEEYEMTPVYLGKGISKVISEAKASSSRDYAILDENIDFYKANRYNAILVTFDKTSTVGDVISLLVHIKEKGMKAWLAFTGEEKLEDSVFMDPVEYESILTAAAKYIDAYLLCWRRTSVHLWKQDMQFINYTCKTIRNANENVAIFGEYYFGENSESNGQYVTACIYRNGLTGLLLCNFGSRGKNQKNVIANVKNVFYNCQLVGEVVGDKPGYLDRRPNGNSYSDNLEIKRKIERKFLLNGCKATVTLQSDGVEYDRNDLMKTLYKNLNSR